MEKPRGGLVFLSTSILPVRLVIDGVSVHAARLRAGRILAQEHPVQADVVVGVPDAGLDSRPWIQQASGIPTNGLLKNKYIGRTFISPGQEQRLDKVKIKLSAIGETVRGKRVVLIDDSIVRGTTSGRIVSLLREAGACEIHGACFGATLFESLLLWHRYRLEGKSDCLQPHARGNIRHDRGGFAGVSSTVQAGGTYRGRELL